MRTTKRGPRRPAPQVALEDGFEEGEITGEIPVYAPASGEVRLMDDAERALLLVALNDTRATPRLRGRVHELVAAQVARTPEAIAVSSEGRALSYAQLWTQAQALASGLAAQGVVRGDLVGVCLPRNEVLPAALLAVSLAGAAYVPLEPSLPPERLADMANDANVALVVADASTQGALAQVRERVLTLDALGGSGDVDVAGEPSDALYVLYTSGSTGKPKGVVVEHRNVTNFLEGMAARLRLEGGTFLSATSYGFDISVLEIFGALAFGMTLVLVGDQRFGVARSAEYSLARELERSRATHFQCTPSRALLMLEDPEARHALRHVQEMLIGGEALGRDVAERLLAAISGRLFNMYGPTETTVWSSMAEVTRDAPISLGRPIVNTTFYVLDERGEPVPRGVIGELYIGGQGVARGYLNRPELTAARFVPDPFCPGARLYRTGDLVRYREDASLEFLGRNDFQVKIRGHRVELGEIETALRNDAGVRECVVIARTQEGREPELVAYVVAGAGERTSESVRAALGAKLPSHMVPARYLWLDALPLTSSGKVDRNALPRASDAPEAVASATAVRVRAPRFREVARSVVPPRAGERWLVLLDETGFGERVRERLTAAGVQVVAVRFGHGPALAREGTHDYRVDSDRGLEGPLALFAELAREGRLPDVVLHLWTVTSDERFRSATNRFHHDLERGYVALVGVAQGLFAHTLERDVRIVTVTNGALALPGERAKFPAKALALGAALTLACESPRISARAIDLVLPLGLTRAVLPPGLRERLEEPAITRLLEEAKGPPGLVALRKGRLFAPALEEAQLAPHSLRTGGTYVVIGGFGGVGHAVARELARRTHGRVALVGRTPLPARAEFAEYRASHPPDDPVCARMAQLEALEAEGASVLALAADVRHPESLRSALAAVREQFGPIHGVIHAAGELDEAALAAQSLERARDALSTQVLGARLLAELCAGDPLDFAGIVQSAQRHAPRAGTAAQAAAAYHAEALGRFRTLELGFVSDRGMYARLADQLASSAEPRARALVQQVRRGVPAELMAHAIVDALASDAPALVLGELPEAVGGTDLATRLRARPYVAPVGDVESAMAALWSEALGGADVGAEDDFFELGGHSLAALRVGAALRERYHVDVPLALFVEAPTVRALSRHVEASRTKGAAGDAPRLLRAWSTLVPLQPEGARPPLFCVGGRGGNVMNLRHLARLLGSDQPVYGLQARGVDGRLAPHSTFAAMVDEYLTDLRTLRPHGPYLLAGFSGGGAVIVEMARRLVAEGAEVAPLVFLDAWNPQASPRTRAEQLRAHASLLRELGPRYLAIVAERNARARTRRVVTRLAPELARRIWDVPRLAHVESAWNAAAAQYQPLPYAGSAILYRVRVDRAAGQLAYNDDPHHGWDGVVLGGIDVVEVPGDHNSLLEEPHVRTLAQAVRLRLDRALRALSTFG